MIKLVQLLREIEITKPVPKFRSNTELFNFIKHHPEYKKQLIDKWIDSDPENLSTEEQHLNRLYNSDVEQANHGSSIHSTSDDPNVVPDKNDPVLLIDEYENIIYISIESLTKVGFPDDGDIIKLGFNTLYISPE